ncbi:PAS domain-containing sensor histidine kinase [Bradyrhizobium sp.]|uniref:hybrid sensor histidine kinase/response regulator n=1 Tax=Bradyrhizobium sp. TaxID=376 RepID=UPI00239C517F|nr:PAS domain-containing sensor histidine kinase [Bradyrhizobium sp.]MDE1934523.1 PAS domain S-box protein [Bradyrhizobium sp.]
MEHTERLEASKSSEGRFRMLVDAVTDYAIYMLDPDGTITSWNAGAKRFKGYEESEIIGENFSRFYTDEDRKAGLPQRALDIAASEGKYENEGWRVRKDGTKFWAYTVIDPIRDGAGTLIGFAKITRDLTERRQAEAALRQSQEQFRLLVQGVTDYAIFMLSRDGFVSSWNLGAQRIKGYAPEEIIGQHFSRFYTEEDQKAGRPREALAVAARTGRVEREGWRVRKDGTKFFAHVVIDAIYNPDGSLFGFAKITRDITERRNAARALEEAREALLQSQKMEAIGHLTGGIAHDFNNLLMAIQGSLELLQRRLPGNDPKVVRLIDNAIQGTRRGAALTQRMLAFARRQELELATVDVRDVVQQMTYLLQSSLGPTVRVETSFPPELSKVTADANQLELAILNLAINGRDAMPTGGTITIGATERADVPGLKAGNYVCISVTDTGTGMNEETLQRAMEPFFTTKGVGKGTGLGLPMVHGMAEQSGGKLTLKSQLGVGTVAELYLPVAPGVPAAPVQGKETVVLSPFNKKLAILTVDDDPLVALNTSALLEELGHTVYSAPSALHALDILRQEKKIDLMITDQLMPDMTGSELASRIRAEKPHIAIILATGYAELAPGEAEGLPRLTKPFSQRELAEAIARAVRR